MRSRRRSIRERARAKFDVTMIRRLDETSTYTEVGSVEDNGCEEQY